MDTEKKEYAKKEKQLTAKIQQLQLNIETQKGTIHSNKHGDSQVSVGRLTNTVQKLTQEKASLKTRLYSLYKIYCEQKKQLEAYRQKEGHGNNENKASSIYNFNESKSPKIQKDAFDDELHKQMQIIEDENRELKLKLKEEKENCEKEISIFKKQLQRKTNEIESLNRSLEDAEKGFRDKKKQISSFEIELEEANTKYIIANKKKESAEKELEEATNEIKKLKSNVRNLENQNTQLSDQLEQEKQIMNEKVRHISQLEISLKKQDTEVVEKEKQEKQVHSHSPKKPDDMNEEKIESQANGRSDEEANNPNESDQQSSILDINDENVPLIVNQLLSKDELKNKALLSMFKIDTENQKYKYKDVLKCMAALFFKQKYSMILRSALSIWQSAAIEVQQQQESSEEPGNEKVANRSCHSEPNIDKNDENDLLKESPVIPELPIKSKEIENYKEPALPKISQSNQDDVIKIEGSYDQDNKNAKSQSNEESSKIPTSKPSKEDPKQNEEEISESSVLNLQNLLNMWLLTIFSKCLEISQTQNKEEFQIFFNAINDVKKESGVLVNELLILVFERDASIDAVENIEYSPTNNDEKNETLEWAFTNYKQLISQRPKDSEECYLYIYNLLVIQFKCQEQGVEKIETFLKALRNELLIATKKLMDDSTIEGMSAFSTEEEQEQQ